MNFYVLLGIFVIIILSGIIITLSTKYNMYSFSTATGLIVCIVTIVGVGLTVHKKYNNTYNDRLGFHEKDYINKSYLDATMIQNPVQARMLQDEIQNSDAVTNYNETDRFIIECLCSQIYNYLQYRYLISTKTIPSYYNRHSEHYDEEYNRLLDAEIRRWMRSKSVREYWKSHSSEYFSRFSDHLHNYQTISSEKNI